MDEEIKQTENTTTEDSNVGSEPQATGLIDGANAAAERLEKANQKQEELITRQEELTAKQMLAGTADAGKEPEVKEETAAEYAKRVMANEE